jgi:hypothetical protein
MASETADKPMHTRFLTRRCGAKSRSGKPCQSPADRLANLAGEKTRREPC